MKILNGEGTRAQQAVVTANAAMALYLTGNYGDYDASFAAAKESLDSKKALDVLKKLLTLQTKKQ